jgi:dTDP-4-dehydrorhamnose reductase
MFWDRSVVDLGDAAALAQRLQAVRASLIINAAAYTAVDKAESERDLSWRVNAEAPASLARAAERLDVPLVQISTDYVFDGSNASGYVETDPTHPLNQYGRSKLAGELAVSSLCRKFWILRTSWVFSEHGSNFPKTMLRLARERTELRVVDDQQGRPTYAGDLAECITKLAAGAATGEAPPWGLYHTGGGRAVSWRKFAETIFEQALAWALIEHRPRVVAIPTSEYPTPAKRPANSLLRTQEAWADWFSAPFDWERGLHTALAAISAQASAVADLRRR